MAEASEGTCHQASQPELILPRPHPQACFAFSFLRERSKMKLKFTGGQQHGSAGNGGYTKPHNLSLISQAHMVEGESPLLPTGCLLIFTPIPQHAEATVNSKVMHEASKTVCRAWFSSSRPAGPGMECRLSSQP